MEKIRAKDFVFLHALLLVYSFSSVCSKAAAAQAFLSFQFFLYYGLVLVILAL